MNTRRTAVCVILTVAVASWANASEPPAAIKGDLAKFQGTWKATVGPEKDIKLELTIEGSNVRMALVLEDGGEFESKGTVKLNEKAEPYKAIDWLGFTTPNGDEIRENPAIYDFEDSDNTLKVCAGGPGNARPADFNPGADGAPYVVVLTRVKAQTEAPAPKGDQAKLQGTWKGSFGPNNDVPLTITFKENAVSIIGTRPDGETFEVTGEVKVDETAKPYKTIDWVKFTRPGGGDAPDRLSIYELEGDDALKLCSGGPGEARPTEFKAGEEGSPSLIVLKREKK